MKILKLVKLYFELMAAMFLTPCEGDMNCQWESDVKKQIKSLWDK